jgi:uncharacterized membrane protein (UPF0127 family)
VIRNLTTGEAIATSVEICDTFWKRGRGLMFRRTLADDDALLFTHHVESTSATTIHMFFVFFDIGVIWLDAQKRVVDAKLARPFRPYYAPRRPAQYFIECHPAKLSLVHIADQFDWS